MRGFLPAPQDSPTPQSPALGTEGWAQSREEWSPALGSLLWAGLASHPLSGAQAPGTPPARAARASSSQLRAPAPSSPRQWGCPCQRVARTVLDVQGP